MKSAAKIIAPIIILVSILMMFMGWIKIDDDFGIMEIIEEEFDDIDDAIEDMEDELDEIDDILKDAKVGLSAKKIVKSVQKVVKIFKDGAIAPSEIATGFDGFLSVVKKLDKLSKRDAEEVYYYLGDIDDIADEMEEVITFITVFKILFWITIILQLLFILFVVINNKVGGSITGIFSIIIMVLWVAATGLVVLAMNDGADVVKMTPAPFISLILIIVAFIVWVSSKPSKKVAYATGYNAPVYNQGYGYAAPNANQKIFCGGCGTEITNGAQFCPICGKQQY